MSDKETLREHLAALAHDVWAGWIRYMFYVNKYESDGKLVLDEYYVKRWQRQAATTYWELTESEKTSDRKEADRVLALLATHPPITRKALAEEVSRQICAGLPTTIFGPAAEGFAERVASGVLRLLVPQVRTELPERLGEGQSAVQRKLAEVTQQRDEAQRLWEQERNVSDELEKQLETLRESGSDRVVAWHPKKDPPVAGGVHYSADEGVVTDEEIRAFSKELKEAAEQSRLMGEKLNRLAEERARRKP